MEEVCFKNCTKKLRGQRKEKQFFCESMNNTLACVIFVKFESRAAASVLHEREREKEKDQRKLRAELKLHYIDINIYKGGRTF